MLLRSLSQRRPSYHIERCPLGERPDEIVRMPELRPAALLREYLVRELRAAPGLPAGARNRHRARTSRRLVARARRAGAALSVLRQRTARRLQLAGDRR